jgi:hypothetical protein
MDPNETLDQLLAIAERIHDGDERPHDAGELADLLDNLDHWLSKGGFLPDRWKKAGR